jgi:hypothetical protein
MRAYSGLLATEFNSHANMAVAGADCTIIAKSGNYADITLVDLPVMKMVEIVDAMMAYDAPISHTTYLLIMRNALSIPSIGHNLIPPFLICKAGLDLDKMSKIST